MNLTQNPQINDLFLMFQQGNNNHHNMLWVETNGKVHLDPVINETPLSYANNLGLRLKFRYEVFASNTETVGQLFPVGDPFINSLFNSLVTEWGNGRTGYIDEY
jgi:hypothetical protein